MVAPVQTSVGKSSNDPVVQDYLTELTNFYADPANEGVESEFTAPDGTKTVVSDSSYLSRLKSNVNTGKLDSNKGLADGADTSLENPVAGRAVNGSDDNGTANNGQTANNGEANGDNGGNGGSQGIDASGDVFSLVANAPKQAQSQMASMKATNPAQLEKNAAQAAQNEATRASVSATFQGMIENNEQSKQIIAATTTKMNASYNKAKVKQEKAAAAAAARAEATAEGDSTTQSGSKAGFEGKLMTTAPASKGSAGSAVIDKSWDNTMKGKIKVNALALRSQEPVLNDAVVAGEKAAQPLLDQAKGFTDSSAAAQAEKGVAEDNVEEATDSQTTELIAYGVVAGIGALLCCNPATASAGISVILGATSGAVNTVTTMVQNYDMLDQQREQYNKQSNDLEAQAAQATADSETAKRVAMRQASVGNTQIIKATQVANKTIQECTKVASSSSKLSSSSLSGVNVEGMDEAQVEAVKKDRYDQIMAHEQEHASVIGGTPVVETDANGVAIGGYVEIEVPSLDEADLEGTIERAQLVIDAALAPSDPSSQDQNIASQAKDVLSRAQDLMEEKTQKVESEEKTEEPKEEVKEEKAEDKKAA